MEELQDESQEQHEAIQELTAYNDARKAMQEGEPLQSMQDLDQPLVYAFQEKDASSYPELYGYGEPSYGGLKRSGDSLYDEERPFKVLNTAASSNDAGTSRGQAHLDASSSNQPSSSVHPTAAWHQYASHIAAAYDPVPPRHIAYPTPQTVFMGSPGPQQFPYTSTPQGWQQNVFAQARSSTGRLSDYEGAQDSSTHPAPNIQAQYTMPSPAPTPQLSQGEQAAPSMPKSIAESTELSRTATQTDLAGSIIGSRAATPALDVPQASQQSGRSSPLSAIEDVEADLAAMSPGPNVGLGISGVSDLLGQPAKDLEASASESILQGESQPARPESSAAQNAPLFTRQGANEPQVTQTEIVSTAETCMPKEATDNVANSDSHDTSAENDDKNLAQRHTKAMSNNDENLAQRHFKAMPDDENLAQTHTKTSLQAVLSSQQVPSSVSRQPRTVHIDRKGDPPALVYAKQQAVNQSYAQPPNRRGSMAPSANQPRYSTMPINPILPRPQQLDRLAPPQLQPAQSQQTAPPQFQHTPAAIENRRTALSRLGSLQSTLSPPVVPAVALSAANANAIHILQGKREVIKHHLSQGHPAHVKQQLMMEFLRLNAEIEEFRNRAGVVYHRPVHAGLRAMPAQNPSGPVNLPPPTSHYVSQQASSSRSGTPYNSPAHPYAPGYPYTASHMPADVMQQQQLAMQQRNAYTLYNAKYVQRASTPAGSLPFLPQNALLESGGMPTSHYAPSDPNQVMPKLLRDAPLEAFASPEHERLNSQAATEGAASNESQGGVSSTYAEANLSIRSEVPSVVEDSGFNAASPAGSDTASAQKASRLAKYARLRKASAEVASPGADAGDPFVKKESPPTTNDKGKQRERVESASGTKRLLRSSPVAEKATIAEPTAMTAATSTAMQPSLPVNRKRIDIALKRGDLLVKGEWDPNSYYFRDLQLHFQSHEFRFLNYYWSIAEQTANRRLIRFEGTIDSDTGLVNVATTVVQPSDYPAMAVLCTQQGGIIISLHFKDGVDRFPLDAQNPQRERDLYWVTNYDVLRLSEYLLGLHVRTSHYVGTQAPRARIASTLNSFKHCITVGKMSKDFQDKSFALQLFACADPKPRENGKQQKLVGWSNFRDMLTKVFSGFLIVAQTL